MSTGVSDTERNVSGMFASVESLLLLAAIAWATADIQHKVAL